MSRSKAPDKPRRLLGKLSPPRTACLARDSGYCKVPRIDEFGNMLLFMTLPAFNTVRIIVGIHGDIFIVRYRLNQADRVDLFCFE